MKTSFLILKTLRLAALLPTFALAGQFAVGPDYRRPSNSVPANYKAADLGAWAEGHPLDQVPKGNWWQVFGDTNLNELETEASAANQEVKAAVARVDQARAVARVSRGSLFPAISANPAFQRQHYSPNMDPSFGNLTASTASAPLDLSYEVDLWGRVRRGFESARAEAQASVAAGNNVLLSVQAALAQNYFALRAMDAEINIVSNNIWLRQEQVSLVRQRNTNGLGNSLEVAQAETELADAQTEAGGLAEDRDQLENAVAILVGTNPASFKIAASPVTGTSWNPLPPSVPAGLPAELLQRRPDVSEAERELAAANAKVGVAKASFFPVLTLTGSGGYLSADVDTLFNANSRTWSLGPSLTLPIFAGGRIRANYQRAQAAFAESAAVYRGKVLVAFGDVEDSLSAIRHLADQSASQARAVENARTAAGLADDRYRSGASSYLEVVDADREVLAAERTAARIAGQRLIASVQLIKSLGGGWNEQQFLASAASHH